MADTSPSKNDLNSAFKRLRALHTNKVCFDCNAKNPSWATVTYGVFICLDCSAVHRSLGVHLSFVKSSQLDSNWTIEQLRNMQLGGNANAETFFRQHNCNTTDAQQKYNSRAAQLYRENLSRKSKNYINLHGTSILINTQINETQNEQKNEVDFFDAQPSLLSTSPPPSVDIPKINNGILDGEIGPNVDAAISSSPSKVVQFPRKSTIGQRKPASKLGAKKLGGLGAQRVKKDFASIEKEAVRCDELRKEAKEVKPTKEQSEESFVSLQKAYEKIGFETKKEEEKLKKVDPKKAAQAERLGMGLGFRSGVSHSLFDDMKTTKQDAPARKNGKKSTFYSMRDSDVEDEFFSDEESSTDNVIRFSSGPPKYKDSPFEDKDYSKPRGIDDLLRSSKSSSNWDDEFEKIDLPTSSFIREKKSESVSANYKYTAVDDGNAQTKFGNAKAISSDMMFGANDPDADVRSNLSRFEASSSISSADLFGESQQRKQPMPSMQAPDLDDVKESVRLGVTKVAGRLSNIATNVMSSLQDRYA